MEVIGLVLALQAHKAKIKGVFYTGLTVSLFFLLS